MSYTDQNTSVHSRAISALFDTDGAAKKAVDDLIAAGIPREHIKQTDGRTAGESVTTNATPGEERGFWDSLKDLFLPDEDRSAYAEGLQRGGHLITVRVDEANYNRALDILDNDGAVNLDEREGQWRSEGWTGLTGASATNRTDIAAGEAAGMPGGRPVSPVGTTGTAASGLTAAPSVTSPVATATRAAAVGSASTVTGTAKTVGEPNRALPAEQGDVLSVAEERLTVGKRDVSHGRVRLRSYVIETPVSEQVSLHSETVSVDRKPVDRPATAADALFNNRTIEVEERAEEAVISKEARVTEEVSLRKQSEDQVRTVSDTVRSTKVDVEDGRSGAVATAARFTAQDAGSIVEHMDVISADGQKIGTVDHLDGPDRIKLAKSTSPDGKHHFVPFTWIDHVDQHVHLKRTLADINAEAPILS